MKYKLVVFDVDGTLTRHISSWQYIHEKFRVWDKLARDYQDQFMAGKIDYYRFCELDAALWKGIEEKKIKALFTRRLYTENAVECIVKLKESGLKLGLISTGLQYMPQKFAEDISPDIIICNRLLSANGIMTGRVQVNVAHDEKGSKLESVINDLGIIKEEVICVGDGRGDLGMARKSGYSIAFNSAEPEFLEAVDHICKTRDLMEVYRVIKKIL
ncbi:HAD family hydrolase [Elusimicrobiota bacterium]